MHDPLLFTSGSLFTIDYLVEAIAESEHKRGLAGFGKAGRPPRVASNAEVRAALIRQMKAMGIIPRGEAIA